MMPQRTVATVLDEATAAGLVPAGGHEAARGALVRLAQEELPWYLRILTGGVAWVAALFLLSLVLGLVAAITGGEVAAAAVLIGLALIPAGLLLGRGRVGEFRRQLSLVCVIAGQMCMVGGIGGNAASVVPAALVTVVTSAALVLLFDEPAYRFMGTLAVVVGLLVLAVDARLPGSLGLMAALTGMVPVIAWRAAPGLVSRHRLLDPVSWACVVACVCLLGLQAVIDVTVGDHGQAAGLRAVMLLTPWPLTLLFAAALVWLALRVARDHATAPGAPTVLGALGVVGAVAVLTAGLPAVSAALLFTALGFDRRRAGLIGLAAATLIGALGLYYYSLALTLWHKSLLLMACGVVCLAGAAFFRQQAREVDA